MKRKYNDLLKRFKKAQKWYHHATCDEQVLQYENYKNLVDEIAKTEIALRESGVEMTDEELKNGFAHV